MAQPQMLQIKLSRFDAQPWGFRLQGGTDFAQPLLVQKVNGGSLAEKAGLMPGDAVLKINDVDVFNLRHKEAQDIVVRSGNNFVMTVQRGGSTWRPHVTPTGNVPQPNQGHLQTVTKTSLAHKQQESQHIGCGYNNAAKPFGNTVDGNVKSIVNKQYNTPVGIYSDESIAETLSAQAEVLAGGVLGVNFKKNEKEYQADKSEVLKFLREEESGTSTPEPPSATSYYATKSHAIGGNERRTPLSHDHDERVGTPLQQNTLAPAASHRPSLPTPAPAQSKAGPPAAAAPQAATAPPAAAAPEQPDPRLIVMPVCPALQTPEYKEEMEKAAAAAAASDSDQPKPYTASGHPACSMCGVGIVGVFVRIKDKNLHVECFKCATCGTSLKNQGYYNFNNKLYCDIHAKLAAMQNPPPGTDGYVPVPIKPNTKLSASTITSALSAHGFNGVSNGSSTPTPAPVAPQQQLPTTTTTSTPPPSSNLPIVDKSLINSDNTKTNSNLNICNSNNTTTSSSNTATNDMSSRPSISEQSASNGVGGSGDKPFEYVTITGNVIRSVVPPGKGTNVNYKVNNQGYARPYGAPPAAAPKSPVTFPPQTQQWNAPPPTQPKPTVPAGNPYATLPRSNVGQGQAGTNQNATSTTATTTAAPLGVCPVTGTFCRPGHTCCKQQLIQSNNNNNVSNGAAYRPNASLGSGNASNNAASCQQQQQQPQPQRQQQLQTAPKQAPAPAPAPTAAASASTNLSTPSSNVGGSNDSAGGVAPKGGAYGATSAPKRGRGIMNKPVASGVRTPLCHSCSTQIRGPFITALGKIWCPEHFHCVNGNCRRPLQDIGFVEEKGDLYCEYCFEKYLAPTCSKCAGKIKGDCLNAIGKHFHPECFSCGHCGKLFGNTPFFLEDGMPYCEADWNELFTTKCFACGFPVEAGDRWVEALNHNYHSQCFNCTYCKQNLEGQSFYNKGGRPFCKNHAR
ncbi:Z band alternatively spliced PDZ-motif protein 52 isoform X17 [Musca autumnalis]|uniref:Z band alternatively spliced PDZ-motif protein 52 isoform X17 n=1 Tax=Musca autumnalis TaxID=221902 RepID=UPI003CEEA279